MRKLITLLTISGLAFSVSAQTISSAKRFQTIPTLDQTLISPVISNGNRDNSKQPTFKKAGASYNTFIGKTYFSNQTNGAVYRRIIAYPDNQLSATWTFALNGPAQSYLNRGSGYNHYNSNWGAFPAQRIEGTLYRTGFPNIDVSPSNKEIIFCHLADTGSLSGGYSFSQNLSIGSNTWSNTKVTATLPPAGYPGALWARTAVSGDYMIVVGNYTDSSGPTTPKHVYKNGVLAPTVWSRYQFSTSTWVTINQTLPGYDSTLYYSGGGDSYSIDSKDSVVAIVLGKAFDDWAMWKSTDYGATWTKKVILTFPRHIYDFKSDTLTRTVCTGDAVHVLVDDKYRVHSFAERMDVSVDAATQATNISGNKRGYSYWYSSACGKGGSSDAIFYWNETMATDSIRVIATSVVNPLTLTDTTYSFASGNNNWYTASNSTWPSASVNPTTGTMYMTYSSFSIGDDDGSGNYYRDIYVCYSKDHGNTWSASVNVSSFNGFNVEEIYPSAAKLVGKYLHITYLNKNLPGNDQTSSNPEYYNIGHLMIDTAQIILGKVGMQNAAANESFSVNQNYPNPFNGLTTIPVNLKVNSNVNISVMSMVGQTVYSHLFENNQIGVNNFEINLSQLKSGVYFYSVEANGFKTTRKMIVE